MHKQHSAAPSRLRLRLATVAIVVPVLLGVGASPAHADTGRQMVRPVIQVPQMTRAGRSRRACGRVSRTIYLNRRETRLVKNGGIAAANLLGGYFGPVGRVGIAGASVLADDAYEQGRCVKLKFGLGYSSPTVPFTPQMYAGKSEGCR
jgi:hypothetical protein